MANCNEIPELEAGARLTATTNEVVPASGAAILKELGDGADYANATSATTDVLSAILWRRVR